MSSTTTTTNAAASAAERLTYWCHECDMSVSLLSSTTPLLCPYCNSDFLEEMDPPLFTPNPNPNPNPEPNPNPYNFPPLASFLDPTDSTTFQLPSVTPADDNFLLDSPYLHRLITHLTNSESDGSSPSITTSRYHSPASKSVVEAIPTIKITNTFLELDPIILCAVCKDQFVVDDETKQLPCKHMYHPDCILPWLSQHNSCPVCRFQLSTEGCGDLRGRRRRSRILRLGELMEDDEELFGFGSTLRHIARRHRLVFPMRRRENREESLFSPTQIGEAEMGVPGLANNVETVSSLPSWPVEGGAGAGVGVGGEDGEIFGVSAARVNDVGDIVMS